MRRGQEKDLLKRIPEDNPLGKINRVLKLDFVREEVRPFLWEQRAAVSQSSGADENDAPAFPGRCAGRKEFMRRKNLNIGWVMIDSLVARENIFTGIMR